MLPDVFASAGVSVPAQATFELSINGTPVQVNWTDGSPASDNLARIAVFDSKCARVYLVEENEVVYLPYGLDAFQKLASLCTALKGRLEREARAFAAQAAPDIGLSASTGAGKLVSALRPDTDTDSLRAMAALSQDESTRLAELEKVVADIRVNDPLVKAESVRRQARRVETLRNRIDGLGKELSPQKLEELKQSCGEAESARKAAELASSEAFRQEPLAGVGTDSWKLLFQAARTYSESYAYPDERFPVTSEGARCVLCQQELSEEAADRLLRFETFVQQAAQKTAEQAQKDLETRVKALSELDTDLAEDVVAELRDSSADLATRVEDYFRCAAVRMSDVQEAVRTGQWGKIAYLPASPASGLGETCRKLEVQATGLDQAAKPEERARLENELLELSDRRKLAANLQLITAYLEALKMKDRYDHCIKATVTTGITRKNSELAEQAVTTTLQEALSDELSRLGASHIKKLVFEKTGRVGTTRHQLKFQQKPSTKASISDVLSEGEQCVVGIASFLAELRTSSDPCGIVFDDPVCSLDHLYRDHVAKRLVKEAANRQAIVFTHDIVFLLALHEAAANQRIPLLVQTVRRSSDASGIVATEEPWHAMPVKKRIGHLRQRWQDAEKAFRSNDQDAYRKQAERLYGLLRETWERAVEEVLFKSTIQRFGPAVQTQQLRYVEVTDDDYVAIDAAMTKCSKWIAGHDQAAAVNQPAPEPSELKQDIDQSEEFVRAINKRQQEIEKRRKAQTGPPCA